MSKKNKHRTQQLHGSSQQGVPASANPEPRSPSPAQMADAFQEVTARRNEVTQDQVADAEPAPTETSLGELKDRMYALVKQLEKDSSGAKNKLQTIQTREDTLESERHALREERAATEKDRKSIDTERQQLLNERTEILTLRAARESDFRAERAKGLEDAEQRLNKILSDHAALLQRQEDALQALARDRVEKHEALNREWEAIRTGKLEALEKELDARRAILSANERELQRTFDDDRAKAANMLREASIERALAADERESQLATVERLASQKAQRHDESIASLEERIRALTTELQAQQQLITAYAQYQRAFAPHTPQTALQRIRELEQELADTQRKLAHAPTSVDGKELVRLRNATSDLSEQLSQAKEEIAKRDTKISNLQVAATHLEASKREVAALEHARQILTRRLDELHAEVGKYVDSSKELSPLQYFITEFDEKSDYNTPPSRVNPPRDLAALADGVRASLAGGIDGRPLYYTAADIRSYLAGMAASRLILLQGISGTGKTSLVRAVAKTLGAGFRSISVQAGWRDRTDLLGYYNAFHRKFYKQPCTEALYEAGTPRRQDRPFFILLDEINLSRVEQFFADFLSVLEEPDESKRRIELMSEAMGRKPLLMPDGRHLPIPPNVWFVGTANHDETTTDFADKTYDRAHVLAPSKDDQRLTGQAAALPTQAGWLLERFAEASKHYEAESNKARKWIADRSPFAEALSQHGKIVMGNRLDQQIDRFVPAAIAMKGKLGEALDMVLETRVLRKLKDRHEIQAAALRSLLDCIEKNWGSLDPSSKPTRCIELLKSEIGKKV